jgi:hypothetical protein
VRRVAGLHGLRERFDTDDLAFRIAAAAAIVGLIAVESALPPVALTGALTFVLAAVLFVERTLIQPSHAAPG